MVQFYGHRGSKQEGVKQSCQSRWLGLGLGLGTRCRLGQGGKQAEHAGLHQLKSSQVGSLTTQARASLAGSVCCVQPDGNEDVTTSHIGSNTQQVEWQLSVAQRLAQNVAIALVAYLVYDAGVRGVPALVAQSSNTAARLRCS